MSSAAARGASRVEQMELKNISNLAHEALPSILESGISTSFGVLADIESALTKADEVPEIAKLIAAIKDVKANTYPKRTIIGVVGSTGAGKSSVINAVLDEEAIVPTNCMRACTAVITELRWNEAEDYNQRYRAEIEFINQDDWFKELRALFSDLAYGGNYDLTSDSEAAVAFGKIKAVYPSVTKQDLLGGEVTAEFLALNDSVKNILGMVMEFSASNSKKLLAQIGAYIDSREKGSARSLVMEHWPLIKVVRIYMKSHILETGLILVDLPGVQDSNAARSAVAAKYIQDCTGLWVVAPITRAVDDKTAKNLMGDSFKRQLQLDGSYSAVTFICSKADDIAITEVMKVLPHDHTAVVLQRNLDELEKATSRIPAQIDMLTNRLKELSREIEEAGKQISAISSALGRAENEDEENVLILSPSKKRASRSATIEPRKRTRRDLDNKHSIFDDDDDDYPEIDITSDSEDELSFEDPGPQKEKLSRRDAFGRLDALNTAKEAACHEKADIAKQQKALKKELKAKRAEIRKLRSEVRNACIQYRNEYSRPSIKSQFADGLREMDQDNAAQQAEDEFDPDVQERDYKQIAIDLPVFCVSSKAYQKMSGRLDRDEFVSGFPSIKSTEIPALQRHALETIMSTRAAACRQFYAELRQYLTSLMMQVVIANQPLKLADELREKELEFLTQALNVLRHSLETTVHHAMDACQKKMRTRVFAKLEAAANSAADQAVVTVEAWGRHRDEGGLSFQTYRATCVRQGAFKGTNGPKDFNEELAEPIKAKISKKWENLFEKHIPEQLELMGKEAAACVAMFVETMAQRDDLTKSPTYKLVMGRAESFGDLLKDTTTFLLMVKDGARTANRAFTPTVTEFMKAAYEDCLDETGKGCFKRMKDHMKNHIDTERGTMFARASGEVKNALTKMINDVHKEAGRKAAQIVGYVKHDYMTLVADKNVFKTLESVRGNVKRILLNADARFDEVNQ